MNPSENVIKTDFYVNELPPEKSLCMAHTVILIDLVFKNSQDYILKCKRKIHEKIYY